MKPRTRLSVLSLVTLALSACSQASPDDGDGVSSSLTSCADAHPWAPGVAYATGALVTYEGTTYRCVQGHTSQSDWAPSAVPALWAPAECSSAPAAPPPPTPPTSTSKPASPPPATGGAAPAGLVFGPYKDVGISMNWNTNVASTKVGGTLTPLGDDLVGSGGKTVTLAFATGECGTENWTGVPGAAMAAANVPALQKAGAKYVVSTGGAAGSFSCGSDDGMRTFVDRWASSGLVGIDFDVEAGQSPEVIANLVKRIAYAHTRYPSLRFSMTLATLAPSAAGSSTAKPLGAAAPDAFNAHGTQTMSAIKSTFGFDGAAATWPSFVTINLMTMDYGAPGPSICVVSGGQCQMGESAIQAAYDLHDKWGVPYANIELTPMIGGNDTQGEVFTLSDVDTVSRFAKAQGLAGVHYWSYDRDTDCPAGYASPICNSVGNAGTKGFLARFLANGMR